MQMMYTIARYYSTSEHMTRLFTKLTNQMVFKCKDQITYTGKLWDQDKPALLVNLKVSFTCMMDVGEEQGLPCIRFRLFTHLRKCVDEIGQATLLVSSLFTLPAKTHLHCL
jgi:hypothetical protein